jgi:acyl-CoA dehydrogenase
VADRSFLGWPFFEDRHRALAEELGRFCDGLPPAENGDVDSRCRDLVARLAQAGLLRLCLELDVRSLCLARESLAYWGGLPDFAFAMQGLGSGAVTLFGTEEQRSAILPDVAAGRRIMAFALSEPEAGSDVAAIATTARPDGDGWVLDGTKTWISNGGIADTYTVFARTGEAPGSRGLSAFVVHADAPGFHVTERIDVIAPHPLATIVLDGCRVARDGLIGEPGAGFRIALATLDVFRPTVGAAALGFARRALDETLARTTARRLFGAPLADLQIVQGKLAEIAVEVDAAALLVYRAAWAKDGGADRVTREAAMAKLFATEAAQRVVDAAVQLHGGMGVRSGHPVERLYREVRALRIYEGASEVQQVVIARDLLAAHATRGEG